MTDEDQEPLHEGVLIEAEISAKVLRDIIRDELRREADRQSFKVPSPWLTIDQAAEYLAISRRSLNELRADRKRAKASDKDAVFVAEYNRPGGAQPRFHRDELDAWMQSLRR